MNQLHHKEEENNGYLENDINVSVTLKIVAFLLILLVRVFELNIETDFDWQLLEKLQTQSVNADRLKRRRWFSGTSCNVE